MQEVRYPMCDALSQESSEIAVRQCLDHCLLDWKLQQGFLYWKLQQCFLHWKLQQGFLHWKLQQGFFHRKLHQGFLHRKLQQSFVHWKLHWFYLILQSRLNGAIVAKICLIQFLYHNLTLTSDYKYTERVQLIWIIAIGCDISILL